MTEQASMYCQEYKPRFRLWRITAKLGWQMPKHDNHITGRIHHLLLRNNHPWWDWGHPMMILTGTSAGGNYGEPSPPTWWYRLKSGKHMWRTHYPKHPLSTFQVIKKYDKFQELTKDLNEDELYEWQAICINCDDELMLGHQYWGGTFYGLRNCDVALLRRYLRMWRRLDWYGLRTWLFSQALHAAVHERKPFSCQVTPPPDAGGYDHWHCQLKRRHDGMHQFRGYLWGDVGADEDLGVVYMPEMAQPARE